MPAIEYTPVHATWHDFPTTDTPINSAALEHIEAGIAASTEQANAALAATQSETVNAVAASGAAQTLPDVDSATIHRIVLSANCTLTFPTAAAGKSFTLALVQDATGGRTVTWPAGLSWPGGTAPTLTTAAGKTDLLTFLCVDGTNWLGFTAGQNL